VPKKILLIEDNDIDTRMIQRALNECKPNAQLTVRKGGLEGIQYLQDGAVAPDLILLDVKMPKVSGKEVLKWVRGDPRLKTVPVVMLTSSDEPSDVKECYKAGANSYVRKPEDADRFTENICELVKYWLDVNRGPRQVLQ
jgi:CheY-like chemotaxis protein